MTNLSGKRIFVVEDDVINMAVISVVLNRQEATVIQDTWNADTTNLLLRSLPVHAILLDLKLRQGANGYDIFDEIQDHPELVDIPVIVISGSSPADEIPIAQAKGFAGFISKPIDFKIFPEQIISCLNGQSVWDTGW